MQLKNFTIFLLLLVAPYRSYAQRNVLVSLLKEHPDKFAKIMAKPEQYEVQILYTQIDRDASNTPSFRTFSYRADSTVYFYPASTVKFACSLLALEKINHLKRSLPELDKATPYRMDSVRSQQLNVVKNELAKNGLPSVAQDIREVLIVSDNFAYDHLFDFLGRDYINEKLLQKGYTNSRFLHRFSLPGIDNRFTAPMTFFDEENKNTPIYRQGEQVSTLQYVNRQKNLFKGKGYLDGKDSLVMQPFDFSGKNYFSLHDQQQMLRATLFPNSVPPKNRFDLSEDDYQLLYKNMSIFPRESDFPHYDTTFYDGFCKFLMYGDGKEKRSGKVRIFNKVGDAYGYMIDNAYIVDFENHVEFMVSAVILSNEDGIFNDGKYEYEQIGAPFFGNLGRVLYDYELKRKRKNQPDLSRFQLKY